MASLLANGISSFSPQTHSETSKFQKGFSPKFDKLKFSNPKSPNFSLFKVRAEIGYEPKTFDSDLQSSSSSGKLSNDEDPIQKFLKRDYKWGFKEEIDSFTIPKGLSEETVRLISSRKNEPDWMLEFRLKSFEKFRKLTEPKWSDNRSFVEYLEGCTAPSYDKNQLHAAVVELYCAEGAEIKYSTVQNWYAGDEKGRGGIYNFVTKRGLCAGARSKISWTQVETGSAITWKYPSVILEGDDTVGEFYSVALTNNYQQADTGTKMIHKGKNTRSRIISKGISAGNSRNCYRGLVQVQSRADNARNSSQCDSMLIGDNAAANTYPYIQGISLEMSLSITSTMRKRYKSRLFGFPFLRMLGAELPIISGADERGRGSGVLYHWCGGGVGGGWFEQVCGMLQKTLTEGYGCLLEESERGGWGCYASFSMWRDDPDRELGRASNNLDHAKNPTARIEHEASTSKIGEDQLFYFQQRGIDYEKAMAAMISGFCRDVFNELPDEFGAEVNQLMSLKLEGSVG
ncbi:ATP binding cassette protein 1 [Actinidia rufa]|uniref:ATP binding cassette protein 1 n=1 Tax=Actinidia rufa TaxID=165716 RepID=A0A7J0D9W3_9ERIC|nr:ATP binding cassette protein 1 [Actinidia rufa]